MGKSESPRAALVFPLVCALGGAVLITHTHSLTTDKEQLLAELSDGQYLYRTISAEIRDGAML